ncbi:YslB family protein [Aquibacillus salsiterrae]|uniref:YslB family protein n=1 Tax=Aquibacillus salsiterrae TaxID=2950439 RepID=A0A9X4AEZ4_9BACI|nr:YslB family protein [Aquibacillus salsiterrae]MDC3415705.1 YslB family protein [Aquibacillus salsiterrae]
METNINKVGSIMDHAHTAGSGYDILRYACLPDLLGKDSHSILYVMGKNIARNLSFSSIEEIIVFFKDTGWGDLTLIKEKRRELIFELTGQPIENRMKTNIEQEYRLEAGVLAEAVTQLKNAPCECIEEIKQKKNSIQLNVLYSK